MLTDLLVNFKRVLTGLLEERQIGHGTDVGFLIWRRFCGSGRELASRDEVATELLTGSRRDGSGGTVSFEPICAIDG